MNDIRDKNLKTLIFGKTYISVKLMNWYAFNTKEKEFKLLERFLNIFRNIIESFCIDSH